eukprot:462249-Rhodomonas_salina.4
MAGFACFPTLTCDARRGQSMSGEDARDEGGGGAAQGRAAAASRDACPRHAGRVPGQCVPAPFRQLPGRA